MGDIPPPPPPPPLHHPANEKTWRTQNNNECYNDGSKPHSDPLITEITSPHRSPGLLGDYPGAKPIKSVLPVSSSTPSVFRKPAGLLQTPGLTVTFQCPKLPGPFQPPGPFGSFEPPKSYGHFQSPKMSSPNPFPVNAARKNSRPPAPFTSFLTGAKTYKKSSTSPLVTKEPAPPGVEQSPEKAEEPAPPGTEQPFSSEKEKSDEANTTSFISPTEAWAMYLNEYNAFMGGEEWINDFTHQLFDTEFGSSSPSMSKPHRATIRHVFYPKTTMTLANDRTTTTFTTSPSKKTLSYSDMLTSTCSIHHQTTNSVGATSSQISRVDSLSCCSTASTVTNHSQQANKESASSSQSNAFSQPNAAMSVGVRPALAYAQWEQLCKTLVQAPGERFVGPMLRSEKKRMKFYPKLWDTTNPNTKPYTKRKFGVYCELQEIPRAIDISKPVVEKHRVNGALASEPEQSSSTMFKLLLWEMYYMYFSLRPIADMKVFLMAVLYQVLTNQISVTAKFCCQVCKDTKTDMQLMEYVIHTQTPQHSQNIYKHILEKDQYGWKALIDSTGPRGWFCEICPDAEWKQNKTSDDFLKHCNTCGEHSRRLLQIQAFVDEAKTSLDNQLATAPSSPKASTTQKKIEMMARFQVENWMLQPDPKKFSCPLEGCRIDKNVECVMDYIQHCERYFHMTTLYAAIEKLGSNQLLSHYVHLEKHKGEQKKYFCGICPIRRPADNLVIDDMRDHLTSKEHTRNVEILKTLYDKDNRGCLYTCSRYCKLKHAVDKANSTLTEKKKKSCKPLIITLPSTSAPPFTPIIPLASVLNMKKTTSSLTPISRPVVTVATSRANVKKNKSAQKGIARKTPDMSVAATSTTAVTCTVSSVSTGKSGHVVSDYKPSNKQTVGAVALKPVKASTKGRRTEAPSLNTATVKGTSQKVKSTDLASTPATALAKTNPERYRKSSKSSDDISLVSTTPVSRSSNTKLLSEDTVGVSETVVNTESNADKSVVILKPGIKSLVSQDYNVETKESSEASSTGSQHTPHHSTRKSHRKPNTLSANKHHKASKRGKVNNHFYFARLRRTLKKSKKHRSRSRSKSWSSGRKQKPVYKTYKRRDKSRSKSLESSPERRLTCRHSSGSKGYILRHKKPHHFVPQSSYSEKIRHHKRSRSRSYSTVSERTSRPSRSSRGKRAPRHRSKSFDSSSDSSLSYSSRSSSSRSPRRRAFNSSRSTSLSRSPRGRRRKRSRSRSHSSSLGMNRSESHRLLRHISPPPFPLNNNSIYWIDPTSERLNVRSLSPVSGDIVSRTVENAWNFYHSRYYSQPALSSDIVYDAQVLFLKSYSGFFTKPSKFENCFKTLYKPEDLKSALRLRLDRLSPGPATAAKYSSSGEIGPQSECQNNLVTSTKTSEDADKFYKCPSKRARTDATNSAKALEKMIETGVVPGLTLIEDSVDSTKTDGMHDAIQSLRQSFSKSGTNTSAHRSSDHIDLDTLTEAEAEAIIPFLNDGTVAEIQKPRTEIEQKKIAEVPVPSAELPWHYHHMSPNTEAYSSSDGDEKVFTNKSSPNESNMENQHSTAAVTVSASNKEKKEQHPALSLKDEKCQTTDFSKAPSDTLMSVFISEVVKGIIRLSTLQGETELSADQVAKQTELEQEKMHSMMTTACGHYMIRMARCRLSSQPHKLLTDFVYADEEALELMQTLDVRVIELIAGTPLLDE